MGGGACGVELVVAGSFGPAWLLLKSARCCEVVLRGCAVGGCGVAGVAGVACAVGVGGEQGRDSLSLAVPVSLCFDDALEKR